ncbi:M14 family zinc carboxypeptidase [Micromonospora sp. NPDC049102]|uniref:M14 family zinc carboxypeptidase n=1 Tax=Micromonospora sp. NPDC049102 TaxID=3364265 RepID=UPI0037151D89
MSTTDEVAAAINARQANRFRATVEDGSTGLPMPVAGPSRRDDGLQGTEVPAKPWTVQALRLGVHRDGSRVGVLAYSQEHTREWATPLVTLEFAERMLANARTDPATRELLEQVDVFVIPTVNPDGANYSFNDYNFQRKNLVNHCTGPGRDAKYRTSWGVDVNRNYTVGSYFDGYVGASANCLSGNYAGTAELSESESGNVIALAKAHPNIRFAADGRITLPRPSIDESTMFLDSARRIVGAIAQERARSPGRRRPARSPTCSTPRPATRPTSSTTSWASSPGTSRSATTAGTRPPASGRASASSRRSTRRTARPRSTRAGLSNWSGWPGTTPPPKLRRDGRPGRRRARRRGPGGPRRLSPGRRRGARRQPLTPRNLPVRTRTGRRRMNRGRLGKQRHCLVGRRPGARAGGVSRPARAHLRTRSR